MVIAKRALDDMSSCEQIVSMVLPPKPIFCWVDRGDKPPPCVRLILVYVQG